MTFTLGPLDAAFRERLAALDAARFPARLWLRDDGLWGDDPAHRKVAANRLGWLDSPAAMRRETMTMMEFAKEAAAEGFTRVVLLGMGGSSLAPEVLRLTFGVRPGGLELAVLDNTSPAAVRAIEASNDPKTTLFLVSSKSGGTIEVTSFERHFYAWVNAARGEKTGRAFAAITDPGTTLEALARARGYRRVFTNPPDIGGRYSALSYFGLVPGALLGINVGALLESALAESKASGPDVPAAKNPGIALGAALGVCARAGRNKMTLVLGAEIAALGTWIEQLVAESTGKNGKGILPVEGEPLAAPSMYGNDRVFVAASVKPFSIETEGRLDALAAAGHPVLRWEVPSLEALGAEFLRWEIATATAGAILEVDPFDEPNVTEAKEATRAVLARVIEGGALPPRAPLASAGGIELEAPEATAALLRERAAGNEPAAWLAALLASAKGGDYVALLAYLHRTDAYHARLERLRLACRAATRCATTLGYGPRFLHSTGQLHKGGPANGIFIQLLAEEPPDAEIPGEKYGFEALRASQAAGDYEVLAKRGRRVVRVWLGSNAEAALDTLIAGVEAGVAAR